jgi:FtsP/CotA-like multicopper oxidase with cupredoxin domain
VANRGSSATIQLQNFLADETITHWHGMTVDDANDGHPRFAIPPGGTKDYSFPIVQRACMNWYHPHPHEKTGEQVNLGLAGAFIIRDSGEEPASLPAGLPYEVPLIIRDAKFSKSGNLVFQTKRSGFEGNTPLVNGTINPTLTVDPAVYRFRVLNGANARIFRLGLDNDVPFLMIGNDGGLLEQVVPISEIDTSPAERLDLLVDFRELQGATVMLRDLRSGWDLLEFIVSSGPNGSDVSLPTPLSTIPQLQSSGVTREFAFEGMSRINGREFEMHRIDAYVPFGQTERWVFSTRGNAPHPVHVHGAPFQVVSRAGGRGQVFPWEQGWKDSVLLEDGETVEVLVRFDNPVLMQPNTDRIYLMHCHKLSHEDAGMMMNFQLIP